MLPATAQIVSHPSIAALVQDVRARCRLFGHDVDRFHKLGRPRAELLRAVEEAVAGESVRARVDNIALALVPGSEVIQRRAYARVLGPGDRAMPFHIDRYTQQEAPSQRALWFPLVDIEGPEGLWLVDDDVMQTALARGPLSDQQALLRAHARPVPMRIGEALLFGAHTGHGSVTHQLDRTRVSFDLRVARAQDAPRGRLGWRSRPLNGA